MFLECSPAAKFRGLRPERVAHKFLQDDATSFKPLPGCKNSATSQPARSTTLKPTQNKAEFSGPRARVSSCRSWKQCPAPRSEDDRADHHLNERDETVSRRFERYARFWKEMPDRSTQKNLRVQTAVPGSLLHGCVFSFCCSDRAAASSPFLVLRVINQRCPPDINPIQ